MTFCGWLARNLTKDTTEENFTAVINGLSPNTNYCVSVAVTQFGINLNTRHIPSAPQCVITEPHHLEGGYGGYMWLIGVAIAGAVIFILMLICLLVSLDKAGFICFGPHFFPKVLKSVPQSESTFFQNKNVYAPASVFAVDVIHKAEQEEDSESVDGQCGQGYAQRKKLHQSSTSAEDNSALHYSTESYSVDTSGQDSGSSAETGKAMEATLLVEIDEGCSSNTEMSAHKLESNENILLNIRDTFNVNLKSVSVGDPERLWTGLQKPFPERGQEPVATIQGSIDLPGARGLKLFTNELDTPIISESEDYCSEEEDHTSDLDEPSVSGYMRR
ncbi:interferon alpha beta receptor 2 [Pelobates cultripes]|uniref:Interferon alpha beta receptor 2 n=2 Tax=Pelobates cultripes TaxID=61616 RepID=A0AAD1QY81_PELCU|nr:interferon alpha beta receptor 2 [Pelobates cultripes]